MNELYRGNDLKFVIYYGTARYNFSIDSDGYRFITNNEFIVSSEPPVGLNIIDGDNYRGIISYMPLYVDYYDVVLCIHSDGIPDVDEYPHFFVTILYRP